LRSRRSGSCALAGLLLAGCTSNPVPPEARTAVLPPGISFRERTDIYRVSGADRAAIGQGISAAVSQGGQQRFAGYYQWNLSWGFQTQREGATCRISLATVAINAVVTLPAWNMPRDADTSLVAEWKRYSAALATHELGHREIVQAGAIGIQRAILEVAPQECSAMQNAVQQVAQPLLEKIQQESARYDETTRHGVTQGAVWPVP
jgi:predicted secreted Zn-dependent protease